MYKRESVIRGHCEVSAKMRKALLVVPAFFVLGGIAFGQVTPPQQAPTQRTEDLAIRGKVILGTAQGTDQRIEVRLEKSGMQLVAQSYTDGAGSFEFRNLTAGGYWVVVNLEGYEEVRQQVEVFPQMGRIVNVSLFLNKVNIPRRELTGLDAADPDVIDVSQMKERFPKKAVQEYDKAIEEKKKGQNAQAMKRLEEAVRLAPDFFHAHNNLGVLYQKAARYRDAEKEFRRARELKAKSAQPLINLGSLFVEEADARKAEGQEVVGKILDNALDILEEAVKLSPRSVLAYFYLGAANYKSSFYEEAEASLKKARELDANFGETRLMLVNVYVKQQRWDEVIQHLDAYLKENPKADNRAAIEDMRAKIVKGLEASKR